MDENDASRGGAKKGNEEGDSWRYKGNGGGGTSMKEEEQRDKGDKGGGSAHERYI